MLPAYVHLQLTIKCDLFIHAASRGRTGRRGMKW